MINCAICYDLGLIFVQENYKTDVVVICPHCSPKYPYLRVSDLVNIMLNFKERGLKITQFRVSTEILHDLSKNVHYSNSQDELNEYYQIPLVVDHTVDMLAVDYKKFDSNDNL